MIRYSWPCLLALFLVVSGRLPGSGNEIAGRWSVEQEHVAAYNWGLVAGKTQTQYPWDSWKRHYTSEAPLWFHDVFRPNGTPYNPNEIAYIRKLTGALQ